MNSLMLWIEKGGEEEEVVNQMNTKIVLQNVLIR